jgi:nickel-dependent lactate racemase
MTRMNIRLDYGRTGLDVRLPYDLAVSVLEPSKGTPLDDPTAAITSALAQPIGSKPLAELARGRRDAVVVISDKTRPVPYTIVLPPLLQSLESAGIARERIEILVATGLHRANSVDELTQMVGADVVARYRIRNHDARDIAQHVHLGRTEGGTEIWLDRGLVGADLKIVTGLIEPHLMAGFSGGRKAVAPGCAGVEMMRSLHGATMLESPLVPASSTAIPFMPSCSTSLTRRSRLACDVTINRARQPTGVFAGNLEAAHAAGVRFVERHVQAEIDRPADVVISCAGGFRSTTRTTSRSRDGRALNVVRRGGTIILAAAITEGIGSESSPAARRDARQRRLHGAHHQPGILQHRPVDGAAPLPGAAQSGSDPGQRRCGGRCRAGIAGRQRPLGRSRAAALPREIRSRRACRGAAAGPVRARHGARAQVVARPCLDGRRRVAPCPDRHPPTRRLAATL